MKTTNDNLLFFELLAQEPSATERDVRGAGATMAQLAEAAN
jgi:hypothetical protein